MDPELSLIGIELVVADLDRALELFGGVLGLDVLHRGPSALVAGELATIDAGALVITLLQPAASGEGTVLAERTPRLSQLVMGTGASDDAATVLERSVQAGLSAMPSDAGHFHISPESVEGAIGQPVAVVVTRVDG